MTVMALVNGKLFNGVDEKVLSDGVVVIKDSMIIDVGRSSEVSIPEDAQIIDVKNGFIMPGMVDAHIHITGLRSMDYIKESLITPYEVFIARAMRDLESVLEAGYTTICDAGSRISLYLKEAVEEGVINSPRIIASGYPISQTFGHGDIHFLPIEYVDARTTKLHMPLSSLICDGVDECRKAARYALREGADFIKIFTSGGVASQRDRPEYPQMTVNEIKAIVGEAESVGKFVHAHAEGRDGIINALNGGVKIIAHGIYIDEDGINLMLEKDAVLIPTLTIADLIVKFGAEQGIPEWAYKKMTEVHEIHKRNIRNAYKSGVKIAVGTDLFVGVKGMDLYGMNSYEIMLLVKEVGMKPIEALKAATYHGGFAAGLGNRIGVLKKGAIADIIVIGEDPRKDIGILLDKRNVRIVIKEGKIVKNIINH